MTCVAENESFSILYLNGCIGKIKAGDEAYASSRKYSHTTEEIYALPEGKRAELIDGQIYDMAPPGRIHQELVQQLSRTIGNYIADHKGTCKVYPAPFAVF